MHPGQRWRWWGLRACQFSLWYLNGASEEPGSTRVKSTLLPSGDTAGEKSLTALSVSGWSPVPSTLEDLAPEERHRIYKLLRLGVRFRPDWPLEIMGVLAQVGEEAEKGSSDSKLSPLSV